MNVTTGTKVTDKLFNAILLLINTFLVLSLYAASNKINNKSFVQDLCMSGLS